MFYGKTIDMSTSAIPAVGHTWWSAAAMAGKELSCLAES
jgi:hypothetical protein